MDNTRLEIGTRVKIVNAPGRKSMQEHELPQLLDMEGEVTNLLFVDGEYRYAVTLDNGWRYTFFANELRVPNGVQNLTAAVATYAQPIEAPLAFDAPTQPVLSAWDMDITEYLDADAHEKRQNEAVLHPLPIGAPVCFRGYAGKVIARNPNDADRYQVQYMDTYYYVERQAWCSRRQLVDMRGGEG